MSAPVDLAAVDLSKLDGILFRHGAHETREAGVCVMEAVAWVAGGDHTDFPACVPREVARLAQRTNDAEIWDSDEQRTEALRPLIAPMLRASHAPEARTRRAFLAAHYAAQQAADALERRGFPDHARVLRETPIPSSREGCLTLRERAHAARRAYAAAAYAAAAYAAAAYAAAAYAAAAYAAAAPQKLSFEALSKARREARRAALLDLLRNYCEVQ